MAGRARQLPVGGGLPGRGGYAASRQTLAGRRAGRGQGYTQVRRILWVRVLQ